MPKSLVPWTLPGDPVLPLHAAPKQYVDAVSIGYAGAISGAWTPDATLARQIKAIITGTTAISGPTNGLVDGYYINLILWSTAATQLVTLDSGISNVGFPTSFQLAPNKLTQVLLRYSGDFSRWTCCSVEQEM